MARDEGVTSRFLNEARAVNEIQHPNVVEITDIGEEGGLHYIVMPFLEGETLGERLERVRVLDEATTLRIARQVCSALDAAHKRGIIHRDLKPENLFLTSHPDFPDHVKVLDFGVAKLRGVSQGSPALTQAGMVVGTPFYMSPEQCRGSDDVDGRSDVYSLAVVLYQALTGKPPFTSEQIMDVMIAHTTRAPVPAIQVNPSIPAHINAAIMRGLEKDPANRFASMLELRDALENPPRPPAARAGGAARFRAGCATAGRGRRSPGQGRARGGRQAAGDHRRPPAGRPPGGAHHAGHRHTVSGGHPRPAPDLQERGRGDRQGSGAVVARAQDGQQRRLRQHHADHHPGGRHRPHGDSGPQRHPGPVFGLPDLHLAG